MARKKIPHRRSKALRQKLDEIDGSSPEDIDRHRQAIGALNIRHTIKYIKTLERGVDCMAYALRIPFPLINAVNDPSYDIPQQFGNCLPQFLKGIPESETSDDQVILYFGEGQTRHAGLVKGNRVISKWGKNPVYEHAIDEVPAGYGDEYEIFKRPSVSYITKKFIAFVRAHQRYRDLREDFEGWVCELKKKVKSEIRFAKGVKISESKRMAPKGDLAYETSRCAVTVRVGTFRTAL